MSAASSSRLTPLTDSRSALTCASMVCCASRLICAWLASVPALAVSWLMAIVSDWVPPLSSCLVSRVENAWALALLDERAGVGARLKLSPAVGVPLRVIDQPPAGSLMAPPL
ncbi:hypothetical protein QE438_003711 [Pseudoxanthomonas sp. SORGH_AS 997]|nr:hypothetical protein [Pseudoxanthomonas sp. SORGH_AS_0997]